MACSVCMIAMLPCQTGEDVSRGAEPIIDADVGVLALQARLLQARSTGRLTNKTFSCIVLARLSSSVNAAWLAFHLSWCVQPPCVWRKAIAGQSNIICCTRLSSSLTFGSFSRPPARPLLGWGCPNQVLLIISDLVTDKRISAPKPTNILQAQTSRQCTVLGSRGIGCMTHLTPASPNPRLVHSAMGRLTLYSCLALRAAISMFERWKTKGGSFFYSSRARLGALCLTQFCGDSSVYPQSETSACSADNAKRLLQRVQEHYQPQDMRTDQRWQNSR